MKDPLRCAVYFLIASAALDGILFWINTAFRLVNWITS